MSDFKINPIAVEGAARTLVNQCHGAAVASGWWHDIKTGTDMRGRDENGRPFRNVAELLMLTVSELSEAMEGDRKSLADAHLPHRPNFEVELADAVIRICDYSEGLGFDLPGAIAEKLEYNSRRADHKLENRRADGGKKY